MTDRVGLQTSLARHTFWRGEPIPLAIVIQNLDDSLPLAVPLPFAPSRSEIRFVLHGAAGTPAIALGAGRTRGGSPVQLRPADFHRTETSLTDWHPFDAGAYTLE